MHDKSMHSVQNLNRPSTVDCNIASQCPVLLDTFTKFPFDYQMCLFVAASCTIKNTFLLGCAGWFVFSENRDVSVPVFCVGVAPVVVL